MNNCKIVNCPYNIAIKQIYCQGGIQKTIENVYTNIQPNTQIPLQFGYIINYSNGDSNTATIILTNSLFIPNITFKIPTGGYKIFNLQAPNGTLKVYVGARIENNNS